VNSSLTRRPSARFWAKRRWCGSQGRRPQIRQDCAATNSRCPLSRYLRGSPIGFAVLPRLRAKALRPAPRPLRSGPRARPQGQRRIYGPALPFASPRDTLLSMPAGLARRVVTPLPLRLRGPRTADLEPDGPEEASARSGVSGAAEPVSRGAPSVSKDDRRSAKATSTSRASDAVSVFFAGRAVLAHSAACTAEPRDRGLEFGLGALVLEVRLPRAAEDPSELGPAVGGVHIDDPHHLNSWPGRVNQEQPGGLATLNAAPELFLGRQQKMLVQGIGGDCQATSGIDPSAT
jgi:hypothetical protein